MKKRGQVTIFLIVGIVLMIIFGLLYYAKDVLMTGETKSSAERTVYDIMYIKEYTESCLKDVSEKGVWRIGRNGGYIDPDGSEFYKDDGAASTTIYQEKSVPYYLVGTATNFPTLEEIEQKLSKYIIVEFQKCLDWTVFKGFNITEPDVDYRTEGYSDSDLVDSIVSINKEDVTVKIEYPLVIRKKDSETKFKDFRVDLPIRLEKLYNISVWMDPPKNDLIKDIKARWSNPAPDNVYNLGDFNCDLYDDLINIYAKDGAADTKIIQLVDYNTFYHNYAEAYVFQFAIKKSEIPFTGTMCTGTPAILP